MPTYNVSSFTYSDPILTYSGVSGATAIAASGPDYFLYTLTDRSTWVMQPAYTRTRHRYRGYRQSGKLNLEAHTFRYDVQRMNYTVATLRQNWQDYMDVMADGGVVNLGGGNTLLVEGIVSLAVRMNTTRRRIEALES